MKNSITKFHPSALLPRSTSTIIITTLVSALAATMSGCQSRSQSTSASSAELSAAAAQASVPISEDLIAGRYTDQDYLRDGRAAQAPVAWVVSAVGETDSQRLQRATAEAARIQAAANRAAAIAAANSQLAQAESMLEVARADADFQRVAQTTRAQQVLDGVHAERASLDADRVRHHAGRHASLESWFAEADRLRTAGDAAWEIAQAEHVAMLAQITLAHAQGMAEAEQLEFAASAASQRGESEALALRARAESLRQQASAAAVELDAKIAEREAFARSAYETQQHLAATACARAEAAAQALRAQAEALSESAIEQTFRSASSHAEAQREKTRIEAQRLRDTATEQLRGLSAQLTRDRLELQSSLKDAAIVHQHTLDEIAAEERLVRLQASIRLARMAEMESDLASDTAISSTARDERANEIIRLRLEAEAIRDRALTQCETRRFDSQNWLKSTQAQAAEAETRLALVEQESAVRIKALYDNAESLLARAAVAYDQAMVSAHSNREESRARAVELRIAADAMMASAALEQQQHSDSAILQRDQAQREAASLRAQQQATLGKAEADAAELLAQAKTIGFESTFHANALRARAAAGTAALTADVAAQRQSAASYLATAQANFNEAALVANSLSELAQARATGLDAAFSARIARAEAQIRQSIADADRARAVALADVERAWAEASAAMIELAAENELRRAHASAKEQIMLAFVEQQHAHADARESATAATFQARLSSLQAQRDSAYAELFLSEQQQKLAHVNTGGEFDLADAALARIHAALRVLMEAGQGVAGVETE